MGKSRKKVNGEPGTNNIFVHAPNMVVLKPEDSWRANTLKFKSAWHFNVYRTLRKYWDSSAIKVNETTVTFKRESKYFGEAVLCVDFYVVTMNKYIWACGSLTNHVKDCLRLFESGNPLEFEKLAVVHLRATKVDDYPVLDLGGLAELCYRHRGY